YPDLMAADILLYDTNFVPVGNDQKQHLELTRDIAIRFNNRFGDTFVIPEPMILKTGSRIMSLTEPDKKMSKSSENQYSKINLLDEPSLVKKKIMKAVTDSENVIRYDPENKPGLSNLLTLYSAFTDISIEDVEARFKGQGYGTFKKELVDVIVERLQEIQSNYRNLDLNFINEVLKDGAEEASEIAKATINKVKDKMGLLPKA
ncbi:MAG: tryptophan--tRNA ligase, partial [Thermoanaerobacterium sp.]|nr:tryptophan--tRNA ligase [Thermoanaerobacterium sp.]